MGYLTYYLWQLINILSSSILLVTLLLLPCIIALIIQFAGIWKTFNNAGEHGFACIIPIYGGIVKFRIGFRKGWVYILRLICLFLAMGIWTYTFETGAEDVLKLGLSVAVFVLIAVCIIFDIINCVKIAGNFQKGFLFGLGLFLFPNIFFMVTGCGNLEFISMRKEPEAKPVKPLPEVRPTVSKNPPHQPQTNSRQEPNNRHSERGSRDMGSYSANSEQQTRYNSRRPEQPTRNVQSNRQTAYRSNRRG